MCRLFGMLSVETSNARKYLVEDQCSLFAQSRADSRRLQSDGWGIGYYPDSVPVVIRSAKPVYTEFSRFVSGVDAANSRITVAHVRRASNPRRLPREKLISVENSQPFLYGKYVFAHNGTINIPDEITACLGEWWKKLKSVNDSEVYFWYIMKEISEGSTFPNAMKKFTETLSDLWQKNKHRYPTKNRAYIGLNAVFSDGERLCAYCKYDKEDELKLSLCLRDQPVFQLSYLINPERLVVTSEKTNQDENWRVLKNGQLMIAEVSQGVIKVDLCKI